MASGSSFRGPDVPVVPDVPTDAFHTRRTDADCYQFLCRRSYDVGRRGDVFRESNRNHLQQSRLRTGEIAGEKEGGIVVHLLHYVEIETSPIAIPESLHININHLGLHQSLTAADIVDLPAGATLVTDPETAAVECEEPAPEAEEEGLAAGAVEPEVIGRKAAEEEDEEK